ncbi:hypothetical protein CBR_g8832 [Chara braunii]|uniref:Uncharacterized protein n=1 Tax=Chara braunii TaxID=69332 RepID=A0A388KMY3_CHABU|nr:hypothetical protein CBR_g8832 [Chara braunii]|eukprot:GBG71412.1 hypothetical protein CBR_g8832 [Chara braunii]
MNHRQSEHEPLEHFQTPLADRLLRHQFNEERQLRYDIQHVNVPAPGVADLAAYSLLSDWLMYAGVYVDVTQLPGRETTRVFIEFRALQVAPNFVHSVATFIGDLTILPQPSRELAQSFVREYAVQAARSMARVQGRGGHRFTAHEALLRRAEDRPIALPEEEAEWDYRIPYPDPPSSRDLSASASHPGVPRSLTLVVPQSRTVHQTEVDFMVEPTTIRLEAIAGAPHRDPAWEPYLTPPFQGCIAARLAGTFIYETRQRPNVMYHFLIFAAQKRERRPYTETHLVMTGPGPRSLRKRVVRAVADLAPRVLSHVSGPFLYPSFVQHHFHEEDASTTPAAMAVFLPPIPPPLNPDIDHFL